MMDRFYSEEIFPGRFIIRDRGNQDRPIWRKGGLGPTVWHDKALLADELWQLNATEKEKVCRDRETRNDEPVRTEDEE